MFRRPVASLASTSRQILVANQARAPLSLSAPATQKAQQKLEPIQELFVTKIREYSQKQKAGGGKLVDSTPEYERSLSDELVRLRTVFKVQSDSDAQNFPKLKFDDPELDPVDLTAAKK